MGVPLCSYLREITKESVELDHWEWDCNAEDGEGLAATRAQIWADGAPTAGPKEYSPPAASLTCRADTGVQSDQDTGQSTGLPDLEPRRAWLALEAALPLHLGRGAASRFCPLLNTACDPARQEAQPELLGISVVCPAAPMTASLERRAGQWPSPSAEQNQRPGNSGQGTQCTDLPDLDSFFFF